MSKQDRQFVLPNKIETYLGTLSRLYNKPDKKLLREIVVNGKVSVHEGWDYDNWNGGTHGHAVTFVVPEDVYLEVMDTEEDCASEIGRDLNKLDHTPDEHISEVFLETEPLLGDKWREESGVYRPRLKSESISLRLTWNASGAPSIFECS